MYSGAAFDADLDDEIFCIGPCHVGASTWPTTVSSIVHLLAEGGQRVETAVSLHPDITTAAPIAACWPTCPQCIAST